MALRVRLGQRYGGSERFPPSVEALLKSRAASVPAIRERLAAVVEEWNLDLASVLHGGWNSIVLLTRSDGSEFVLKLTGHPQEAAAEATALQWWGEECAPRVLRHDSGLGALLLERLIPGTELPWVGVADTAPAVPLLRALHSRDDGADVRVPTIDQLGATVFASMSDNFNRKRELVDGDDVERAEQLLRVLFAPPPLAKQVVLHGDLVPANVVRAGRSWRVIDPRPCRGEPAYDAGYWAVFSGYGRGARANVTLLAEELHLDEQHVLAWSWGLAVHRLLQIVDSTDPGHPPLVTELRQFIDEARSDVAV